MRNKLKIKRIQVGRLLLPLLVLATCLSLDTDDWLAGATLTRSKLNNVIVEKSKTTLFQRAISNSKQSQGESKPPQVSVFVCLVLLFLCWSFSQLEIKAYLAK